MSSTAPTSPIATSPKPVRNALCRCTTSASTSSPAATNSTSSSAARSPRTDPFMWRRRTLELGGGRTLHVAQAGEGPDLLLIHGALATMHDWIEGPAPSLAQTHRVTIVDRPGHGGSGRPRFEATPRDQALHIAAALDALGIASTQVLGHSFGGFVALALAEQRPDLVSGLALLAPLAFPELRAVEHSVLGPRAMPLLGPLLSAAGEATRFDR